MLRDWIIMFRISRMVGTDAYEGSGCARGVAAAAAVAAAVGRGVIATGVSSSELYSYSSGTAVGAAAEAAAADSANVAVLEESCADCFCMLSAIVLAIRSLRDITPPPPPPPAALCSNVALLMDEAIDSLIVDFVGFASPVTVAVAVAVVFSRPIDSL